MAESEKLTQEANERTRLRKEYLGKKIRIINMVDESQYKGKTGIVQRVDDIGQLHGTWGGYNFYEVVGLTKTMIKVRELVKTCAEEQSNYSMYYGTMVKPVTEGSDRFKGGTIMRKPFNFSRDFDPKYSGIAINSFMCAYPWDGKACDEYNAH